MPFADVNGARLFYTDEGAGGPPLLLVHGWTCDSHDWSWQLEAFSEHHRVVAVDLRGHGRSSVASDYAYATLAADLAALLELLDTGPAVVVGHSLGGGVAAVMAVERPSAVQAVVGVDPAIGIGPQLAGIADAVAESMSGPGANEFLVGAWVGMEGPASAAGLRAWHRRRALGVPWEFLAETWKTQVDSGVMFRPAADEYLARRECPVLSIYNDPERADWETGTFRHPESRALTWVGCGHWLHQERPLEFNRVVLDWVAGLSSAQPAAAAVSATVRAR